MKNHAIGIDLGGTNLKGVVMDRNGTCRHLTRVPTEADQGGKKVLENILSLIGALIEKEGTKKDILGVGIGTPGFVDAMGVVSGAGNLPGWEGTNVYKPIQKRFGLPATAGNDVTVAALAESRYGAGKGVQNLVCLALGTGIGGGIVANGQLYKGTFGMAGELGHISVETDGILCSCGVKGCVERYASGPGIVRTALELCRGIPQSEQTPFSAMAAAQPGRLTSKIVYDYVKQRDPMACRVNELVCDKLARIIGIMVNALSPDRIILGGGVMMAGKVIIDTTAKYVPRYCLKEIWRRCKLVRAQCGENAGVLGAAQLVFEDLSGKK
jgi:glucokinase